MAVQNQVLSKGYFGAPPARAASDLTQLLVSDIESAWQAAMFYLL
jgi:hypothetical protein